MTNNIRQERRVLGLTLLALAFGYFLISDALGGTLWVHQPQDSYTLQALNWLQGRLYLEGGENYTWLELAIYEGRYYCSFPPLPSVVLLPLVLLFGVNTPNYLLVALYGLGSVALAFYIMRRLGRSPGVAAFWGVFLVWGSNMLWMTTDGGVWFQAQALNMLLCLAAILAFWAKNGLYPCFSWPWPWAAGLSPPFISRCSCCALPGRSGKRKVLSGRCWGSGKAGSRCWRWRR